MPNPFEIQEGKIYYVLVNEEQQYSLWPQFVEVPLGWKIVYGLETQTNCLDYISQHWKDQRPKKLCELMGI